MLQVVLQLYAGFALGRPTESHIIPARDPNSVCVCVSHPGQRVFHHHPSTSRGPAADKQTLANKAMLARWMRSETSDRVPAKKLLTTLSNLIGLLPWCFMFSPPNPRISLQCSFAAEPRRPIVQQTSRRFAAVTQEIFVKTSTIALTFHLTV